MIENFIKDLKEYVLKIDIKGRITFISEKFLAKLEIEAEDYIDKDLSTLLTPGSQIILKTIINNLKQMKHISQVYLEFKLGASTPLFFKSDFSRISLLKVPDFILVFCEEIIVDNSITKELQKYQLIANQKDQLFYDYYTDTQIGRVFGDLSILSGVNISHSNEVYLPDLLKKIHPADRERNSKKRQDSWDNNSPAIYKYRLQAESGKYLYMHSINHVIPDDERERKHVFGIFRSIPKEEYFSSNLNSNQSRIQTIYENISEIIWELKPNKSFNFISSNLKRVLGWESSEIVANRSNYIDLIHPDDRIHYDNALNKLVYQSDLYNIEYRIKHKDDSWRWVNDRAINITGEGNGKIFLGLFVDSTEKRKIEGY